MVVEFAMIFEMTCGIYDNNCSWWGHYQGVRVGVGGEDGVDGALQLVRGQGGPQVHGSSGGVWVRRGAGREQRAP